MSGRDYYLETNLQNFRDAYKKLTQDIAELFGATTTDAAAFADRMLVFETEIANVSLVQN